MPPPQVAGPREPPGAGGAETCSRRTSGRAVRKGRARTCSSGSPPLSVIPPLWSPWLKYGFTRSSFRASSLLLVSLPAQQSTAGVG